jgi:hypothetical protein
VRTHADALAAVNVHNQVPNQVLNESLKATIGEELPRGAMRDMLLAGFTSAPAAAIATVELYRF